MCVSEIRCWGKWGVVWKIQKLKFLEISPDLNNLGSRRREFVWVWGLSEEKF